MSLKPEITQSNRRQVIQAAGIVGGAFILSRVIGLARQMVITFYYGVDSLEATAYETANRFPEAVFFIIAGGALGSAFIPTFAGYFARDDSEGGWYLFSAVINLVTLATTVVAGLTALFAPQVVTFFLEDLLVQEPELFAMTVPLLRVLLLSSVIFGVSGVIMGSLNARQHFLLPAIAPTVYNLGIILGAILFAPNVMGLAIGAVLGSLGHLLIQLPALRQKQVRYRPVLGLRDPGVRQVLRLMAPRVLGLSFSQINHLITTYLAQAMIIGSIPALGNAWRVMVMPQSILGQAMGIAAFPTLAMLAAKSALGEMRRIVADSLRSIFFLGIPATVLLILLRRPLVTVLFERGRFTAIDRELVAWALLFYSLALTALAALEVISRAFYALEDTRTPVAMGGVQLAVMGVLGWWASFTLFPRLGWLPLGGLALAVSLSNFLEVGLLLWLLRRKMGGIDGRHLADGLWRMSLAGLVMAAAVWPLLATYPALSPLVQLLLGGFAGGLVYFLACLLLRVSELWQLLHYGRRRLRIRRP